MLAVPRRALRQPVRRRTGWPATPARALDDARDVVADAARLPAGRGRVHRRRHRGRQPGRARRARAAAAAVRVCSAIEHHAVLDPVERLGGRGRSPSTARAASISTRSPRALDRTDVTRRVGDARSTTRSARSSRLAAVAERRAGPAPRRGAPHRRGAGAPVARRRRAGRARRPGLASAPTSSAGPRASARWSCATASSSRRCCSAAGRSASGAAARQNVAGIVGAGRGAAPRRRRPSGDGRRGCGRAARPAGRRAAGRPSPACRRDRSRRRAAQGRRHRPRLLRGRRERGAAVPARPGRRVRVGGVVVRQRGAWSRRTCWPRWACDRDWRAARCASRSAGRPPTPTSTARSPSIPPPSPACGRCADPLSRAVKVLVAMSGGVDSSVAAALLRRGRATTSSGVTMKLWGGESDTGCCSVADVDDARRVAAAARHRPPRVQLRRRLRRARRRALRRRPRRRPHAEPVHRVQPPPQVRPAAATGPTRSASTPSPPATTPGSSALADGTARVARGADAAKDQSYVLHMLGQDQLARVLLPGRRPAPRPRCGPQAAALGLRTADQARQPGRLLHHRDRRPRARSSATASRCTPGRVVDTAGAEVGAVDAVELVTVGQRRGLGLAGGGEPPRTSSTSTSPSGHRHGRRRRADLLVDRASCSSGRRWVGRRRSPAPVLVQCSAHGTPSPARSMHADGHGCRHRPLGRAPAPGRPRPERRRLRGDEVLGGGIAT